MSANTRLKTGSRLPGAAGTCKPDCAISANRPTVLSATVLPPVLGPEMTRTDASPPTERLTGTGSLARVMPSRAASSGISSGCLQSSSSKRGCSPRAASTISGGWAFIATARSAIACTASSSPSAAAIDSISEARSPTRAVSSCRMRTTSRRSASCSSTMSLLSSTAGSGSTNRLAPEPELPWTMPGSWPFCSAFSSST